MKELLFAAGVGMAGTEARHPDSGVGMPASQMMAKGSTGRCFAMRTSTIRMARSL